MIEFYVRRRGGFFFKKKLLLHLPTLHFIPYKQYIVA